MRITRQIRQGQQGPAQRGKTKPVDQQCNGRAKTFCHQPADQRRDGQRHLLREPKRGVAGIALIIAQQRRGQHAHAHLRGRGERACHHGQTIQQGHAQQTQPMQHGYQDIHERTRNVVDQHHRAWLRVIQQPANRRSSERGRQRKTQQYKSHFLSAASALKHKPRHAQPGQHIANRGNQDPRQQPAKDGIAAQQTDHRMRKQHVMAIVVPILVR